MTPPKPPGRVASGGLPQGGPLHEKPEWTEEVGCQRACQTAFPNDDGFESGAQTEFLPTKPSRRKLHRGRPGVDGR